MEIDGSKRSRKRSIFYTVLSFFVSCFVFTYLFSQITFAEVKASITGLPFSSLALFVFASFTMSFCRTWRYQLLLKATGIHLSSATLFLITLVRNFFSDLLPARIGTLVYVYILNRRFQVPISPALSSFSLCFIFDIISVSFLAVFCALFFLTDTRAFSFFAGGGVFLLAISTAILCFLSTILKWLQHTAHLLKRFHIKKWEVLSEFVQKIENDVLKTQKTKIYYKVFALSLCIRSLKYISMYILFIGLVIGLGKQAGLFPLPKVVSGMIAAELAASLPVSGIAGFGAYEGTWSLVFQLLGYSEKLASLTAISHHLITQVYGYSLGALALILLLLPYFKSCHESDKLSTLLQMQRHFWKKLLLLIFSTTFITVTVFQGLSTIVPLGTETQHQPPLQNNIGETQLNKRGTVVYHRTKKIFLQKAGKNRAVKIVDNGYYPRLSYDGKKIAYIQGKRIMVINSDGKNNREVSVAHKPLAVSFHPDGKHILYIDGKTIWLAEIKKRKKVQLLTGYHFKEIDIDGEGKRIIATVKKINGYHVMLFDLEKGSSKIISKGCSASFSPDGQTVTVNDNSHRRLTLIDIRSNKAVGSVLASHKHLFDNQKWSNNSDWIVSTSEKEGNIYAHQISTGRAYRLTTTGNCDRADLFFAGK